MKKTQINPLIKNSCPKLRLGQLSCQVVYSTETSLLWESIQQIQSELRGVYQLDDLSQHPVNGQTREGYKACGKKPGRYRPSAEALMRRVLQQKDLYRINNIVDTINMLSVQTGFSIGGYDTDKIKGELELGIGNENEDYAALGRGNLNIFKLPVLRDEIGAFGSPTSDSERTAIQRDTTSFLMVFFDFGSNSSLLEGMDLAEHAIAEFAKGTQFDRQIIQ